MPDEIDKSLVTHTDPGKAEHKKTGSYYARYVFVEAVVR